MFNMSILSYTQKRFTLGCMMLFKCEVRHSSIFCTLFTVDLGTMQSFHQTFTAVGTGTMWLGTSLVVPNQQPWILNKWMVISLWGSVISLDRVIACMTLRHFITAASTIDCIALTGMCDGAIFAPHSALVRKLEQFTSCVLYLEVYVLMTAPRYCLQA